MKFHVSRSLWNTPRLHVIVVLVGCLAVTGGAIKCWECNSKYDSRCKDPFSNFSVALVDCDQRKSLVTHLANDSGVIPRATLCRKTVQYVVDEERIIRGCGWVENEPDLRDRTCFKRAGTKDIQMFHCICSEDACNVASTNLAFGTLSFVKLISLLTSVTLPQLLAPSHGN